MQGMIAVLVVALTLAFGNAVCGHHPEGDAKVVQVNVKKGDGGWLGVAIQDVTEKLAQKKDLKVTEGAYVNEVIDESPADSAGLKGGDIIVDFGEKKIADADDLMKAVTKTKPGTEVTLGVVRDGQKKSIKATLGKSPRRREVRVVTPRIPPIPPIRLHQGSSLYGMSVMELSDQLGEYFEAPGGKGVLIERVKKGSDAEKGGFKAGDVITRIGKVQITDVDDIWEAMDDYNDGEKVEIEVVRKGTRKTMTLEADASEVGHRMHFNFDRMPHIYKHEDFDLEGLEDLDELAPDAEEMKLDIDEAQRTLNNAEFKRDMERLKQELKQIPEKIQEQMKDFQKQMEQVKMLRTV